MARHTAPPGRQSSRTPTTSGNAPASETRCYCDGRSTCRPCRRRRSRAWDLIEVKGVSYEQAAQLMRLTPEQVRLVLDKERDRRDLKSYELNRITCENLNAFVQHEMERDPELTVPELAHRLDMRQIDLERQLGRKPGKNGKLQRHVDVATASRIVIALGRAPRELDGC